jgi:hypothetical protein
MLLETRYSRLTFNVFTLPKTGSQTARPLCLTEIYFHNQILTLEIRVIVANMDNRHIFYIIGYGLYFSEIVARFHVGVRIYFLFGAPRETVRHFQPPVHQLYESLLLLLSIGLPVANAPDVLQPCGLLYYP